jgi:hypothetical protein
VIAVPTLSMPSQLRLPEMPTNSESPLHKLSEIMDLSSLDSRLNLIKSIKLKSYQ